MMYAIRKVRSVEFLDVVNRHRHILEMSFHGIILGLLMYYFVVFQSQNGEFIHILIFYDLLRMCSVFLSSISL